MVDNEKVVADYKAGKEAALMFLVGQGMKATKGAANPEVLKNLIKSSII
jgi:aspartyl-tRNA(Asn)/glutamyl-tRNA(Gln) amidotransferase subunit B